MTEDRARWISFCCGHPEVTWVWLQAVDRDRKVDWLGCPVLCIVARLLCVRHVFVIRLLLCYWRNHLHHFHEQYVGAGVCEET